MKFKKKPTSLEEQVALLKSRGVEIDNDSAMQVLLLLNYYRFCGYGLNFEEFDNNGNRLDKFLPQTTFNRIYNLYLWDEKLRTLLQKYLGRFEIMFRSVLNYVMVTETQDPFWFLDDKLFTTSIDLINLRQECVDALERAIDNNELSAVHFKTTYAESDVPPCWILSEYLSFGKWSKIFGTFKFQSHVKMVAARLKAPPHDVVSWVRCLVILRNRCAHHGRLWGYRFKIRPSRTPAMQRLHLGNDSVGALIFILHDLLSMDMSAQKEMTSTFNELIWACPENFENALGLPKGFRF
ncbi:Abi family protein [Fibrobacter sp. UWT2]|uniref:Abi family protein n=1 Tax=Fibrobacter sp. UWT2 TaxID=1896224 RepID=UPI00116078E4|nr:Abi family protein [Fibrobacter sp. UWT2]